MNTIKRVYDRIRNQNECLEIFKNINREKFKLQITNMLRAHDVRMALYPLLMRMERCTNNDILIVNKFINYTRIHNYHFNDTGGFSFPLRYHILQTEMLYNGKN
jgi:hypothetical protein